MLKDQTESRKSYEVADDISKTLKKAIKYLRYKGRADKALDKMHEAHSSLPVLLSAIYNDFPNITEDEINDYVGEDIDDLKQAISDAIEQCRRASREQEMRGYCKISTSLYTDISRVSEALRRMSDILLGIEEGRIVIDDG